MGELSDETAQVASGGHVFEIRHVDPPISGGYDSVGAWGPGDHADGPQHPVPDLENPMNTAELNTLIHRRETEAMTLAQAHGRPWPSREDRVQADVIVKAGLTLERVDG